MLVNRCVRFLVLEGRVAQRPIKTAKMKDVVLKDYPGSGRLAKSVCQRCTCRYRRVQLTTTCAGVVWAHGHVFRAVMGAAQQRVRQMFGLDLAVARQAKLVGAFCSRT